MPRYRVTKVLRFEYQVDAESEEAALQVPWPREDPDAVTILRQRARDLDRPASAGARVIADRVMRAGRTFQRAYAGQTYTATVVPGGKVKLEGGGLSGTFKNLHAATQAILKGKSANAWAWWHEVEPVKKEKNAAGPPKPKKGEGKSDEGEAEQEHS